MIQLLKEWKPNKTNLILRNTLQDQNQYAFELDLDHGEAPDGTQFSSTEMNKIVDEVNRNTPPGVISAFAGNRAPEGWLLCDGKVYKTEFYEQLYSVIGNTYGGDTEKGEFALPNLCGRVPVGLDPTAYSTTDAKYQKFNTLGYQDGRLQQELRAAIGTTDNDIGKIAYERNYPINGVEYNMGLRGGTHYEGSGSVNYATSVHPPEGGNMYLLQPYLVLNYIIKY